MEEPNWELLPPAMAARRGGIVGCILVEYKVSVGLVDFQLNVTLTWICAWDQCLMSSYGK